MTAQDDEDELLRLVVQQNANSILKARQRAERRSEFYLSEGERLAHIGSWAFNPSGFFEYWSPELFRIHGVDSVKGAPTLAEYLALVHPEDREFMARTMEQILAGHSGCDVKNRIVRPDGEVRYVRCVGVRVVDHDVFKGLVGTAIDVTEQELLTGELQQRLAEIKVLRDQLYKENFALREEVDTVSMFEEIVGASPALQAVLSKVSKVAPVNSTVLITGETGTGKELVARAIHRRSQRSSHAFVSVNCAAIPRDLIPSELFGHEKGAFTGATQRRLGRFELADGGTIFLDEIGEVPIETQIALLRVLQEHEFERVGGTRSIQTDARVIAATNRNLQFAISAGTFRGDLFYRLNVFPIEIPALRERREDIPLLVEYFIDRYARKAGKNIQRVSRKSMDLLQSYAWPGNIRELQNIVERSVILCETENFSVDESWLSHDPFTTDAKSQPDLSQGLAAQEKAMIETALRQTRGRVSGPSGAAAKLGIPRSTLESKIRSLKIDKIELKSEHFSEKT